MKKRLFSVLILTMVICLAFPAFAVGADSPHIRMSVDEITFFPDVHQHLVSTSKIDGVAVETYEAEVSCDFYANMDGELIPIENGVRPQSTISEDMEYLSRAVKWVGTLTYTKTIIEGHTCYTPSGFSHKLTVQDNNFVLTNLTANGGATGKGFDTENNNLKGTYSTRGKTLSVSNPTSGTKYSRSLSTRYAYSKDSGTAIINTYGTFKYYRISETNQPIHTSPEFEVSLL